MELLNFSAGYNFLIRKLVTRGYRLDTIIPINNKRYIILIGSENLMVTYKRDFFFNFGRMFGEKDEVGDTINETDLENASRFYVKEIYSIFKDGTIIKIDFDKFLTRSKKWVVSEGKAVRSLGIKEYEVFE